MDWSVQLCQVWECRGSDVAVLWHVMDQSEGRKHLHAIEHRGSADWQCFGSDCKVPPPSQSKNETATSPISPTDLL